MGERLAQRRDGGTEERHGEGEGSHRALTVQQIWGQLEQKEQESRSLLENRREKYSSDSRNISMHGKLF